MYWDACGKLFVIGGSRGNFGFNRSVPKRAIKIVVIIVLLATFLIQIVLKG